jgi:DNA-binding NtrC family response regulator
MIKKNGLKECKTILLVDDVEDYLDTMEINLPEGCRAVRAASIAEAKKLVETECPLLAVIDIRLDDKTTANQDGLELLKWIQNVHSQIAVIMISAYQEFGYAAESLALGAEYFLRKPIQPDEFRETIQNVLAQKQDDK